METAETFWQKPNDYDPESGFIGLTTYNLEVALSYAERQEAALEVLTTQCEQQQEADVLAVTVLPEAYVPNVAGHPDQEEGVDYEKFLRHARKKLGRLGYRSMAINQEIDTLGVYPHGLVMFADERLNPEFKMVRLLTRYAIVATLRDPQTRRVFDVYGDHLPDRYEQLRTLEARKEITYYKRDPKTGRPVLTVSMGDKNTMRRDRPQARLLRALNPIAERLPGRYPTNLSDSLGPREYMDGLQRLTRMALGGAYAEYINAGLSSADPDNKPTKYQQIGPFGSVGMPIDHVFYTREFETIRHAVPVDTMVWSDSKVTEISDHRRVIVLARLRPAGQDVSSLAA